MPSARSLIVEPIGVDLQSLSRPMVLSDLFGNDHPVELEIGMGRGTFLTDQAKARPDSNFLGLEYANWYWRYASDRLRRNGCSNARTARAEAAYFLKEFIASAALAAVHIYFPDPWPKTRHHKRRLIQPPFLALLHRVLQPGALVRIVTDHAEYFQQIQQVLNQSALQTVDFQRPLLAGDLEFAGTNFERKYRREGRPFFAIAARRRSE